MATLITEVGYASALTWLASGRSTNNRLAIGWVEPTGAAILGAALVLSGTLPTSWISIGFGVAFVALVARVRPDRLMRNR